LWAEHCIVRERGVVHHGVGATVEQRDVPQAQVHVRGHRQSGPARCLQDVGEAAADVLMKKAARGGVHDDGSVNDLDPAADVLRERLVFLGTQAVRPVHPVRQGSHRTPPFLVHCQANGNWWLLPKSVRYQWNVIGAGMRESVVTLGAVTGTRR
jgi:hypothetical protein